MNTSIFSILSCIFFFRGKGEPICIYSFQRHLFVIRWWNGKKIHRFIFIFRKRIHHFIIFIQAELKLKRKILEYDSCEYGNDCHSNLKLFPRQMAKIKYKFITIRLNMKNGGKYIWIRYFIYDPMTIFSWNKIAKNGAKYCSGFWNDFIINNDIFQQRFAEKYKKMCVCLWQ